MQTAGYRIMIISHLRMCTIVFAGALALSAPALGQTVPRTPVPPIVPRMEMATPIAPLSPEVFAAVDKAMSLAAAWTGLDPQDRPDRQAEAEQRERDRETRTYDQGRDLIDQG